MLKTGIVSLTLGTVVLGLIGCATQTNTDASAGFSSFNAQSYTARHHNLVEVEAEAGTIDAHLNAMRNALILAQSHAEKASTASSIEALKSATNEVYKVVWGHTSGLNDQMGAVETLGWRARWQTTYAIFDPDYSARYGSEPDIITDPAQLGIVGRGRYVRRALTRTAADNSALAGLLASLNNVIGWHRLDDGVTKAERQPRIDLTYMWDAEQAFWLSTADTGWLFEVGAQAINILKTDYQGDLVMAQSHAAELKPLIDRCLVGRDQNGDGAILAIPMEGGLQLVLKQASLAEIR